MANSPPAVVTDETIGEPVLSEDAAAEVFIVPRRRSLSTRLVGGIRGGLKLARRVLVAVFSFVSLVVLLAVVAAVPVLNLWALGYLIQAEGNIARTGKFSSAFPLLGRARQLGGTLLGIAVIILPLRYLGGFASDMALVDPTSGSTVFLQILTTVVAIAAFVHLSAALCVGQGGLRFFRPRRNLRVLYREGRSGEFLEARSAVVGEFVRDLEIRRNVMLGLLGAAGVLMWTLLPTALYASANAPQGPQILVTLLGGVLLALVCSWAPILQAGYAREEKFSAYRRLSEARLLFRRAPLLWTLALLVGYALSLVLYLFKIVAPPQDALWMMTIVFIAAIYPARIFLGWVCYWSTTRTKEPHRLWRWLWSLVSLAVCGFYVFLLFFTRNIGAQGKLVLFEQPLLLIPSPF
ncbi:hypothetical protein [Rubinisphaera margarita]|uniref:hypothetical protein n=1 Tax=Rubinisphaera margarita TaxID=2909586 RepID=UPI001EE7BC1C|nr:hypothetical protein [Rubinisphaera margarita]MCG6154747.1 hypothetical protein [Rubinisphaera margarita]